MDKLYMRLHKTGLKHKMTETPCWRDEVSRELYNSLEDMYKHDRHTDTKLVVGDRTFNCHRVVLAAISPYFDAMFSSGMIESQNGTVNIQDCSVGIFENILDFIYTGRKVVTFDNCEDLLKAAAIFQMRQLHEKCEQFLLNNLISDNSLGAWKLAKSYDCPSLCTKAWTLILMNFTDICRSEDFLFLDKDDLIKIITDDNLNVTNEEVVCDAVFRWYESDVSKRKDEIIQLFEYLRLPLLGSEYLLHEVEPMELVRENARCREIVKEAITYHMLPARRSEFNSDRIAFRNHLTMEEVLIVLGGYNSQSEKVVDVFAYSFLQQKWFFLTPLMFPLGREFASCVYGNDIFVSGGSQKLDCLLRYRSENNEWYRCTSPVQGRRRHSMVALGGSIYVLGGYDDNIKEESSKTLSSVEEYDINQRTWKKAGHLPKAVRSMSSTVSKEKIFVFGGILSDDKETKAIQYFDTRLQSGCIVANLPSPCKLSRAIVSDKNMHVVCTDGSVICVPEDGSCRIVTTIPNFQRRRFCAIHHKGNVLILGGESGNSIHQNIISVDLSTKHIDQNRTTVIPPRANFAGLKIVMQKKFFTREFVMTEK
ncbi:kelch-like protein 35 isoform X1 [Mytilus galloprovincialis]|uniref:kelch-like protein 35 isoform X1 n=2 Tax=Mytilus galloprovincialis TaxID=29158 RepID=UPI003F7C08ED